jgi:phosphatidylinositol-3-phosphatase
VLAFATSCSSGSHTAAGDSCGRTSSTAGASTAGSTAGSTARDGTAATTRPSKLLVVVLENRGSCQATSGMPRLTQAAARYGQARQSFALTHPSLGNYLAIAGGSTFGVRDDKPPSDHPLTGASVFGQVLAAGHVAKTYAEGMQGTCELRSRGRYAVKHNPWPYFTAANERAGCRRYDIPSGTPTRGPLHDDIAAGTLPTFALLIPDLCHDAHDCSLGTADRWLAGWLRPLLAGPDFRAGHLAVVVTFDEDDHHAGNHIYTAVLHPALHGAAVDAPVDHNALSGAASRLVGARPLRTAAQKTDLLTAFGLAPTQ